MKFQVANDNGNSEQDMIIGTTGIAQPNVHAKLGSIPNLDEVNSTAVLQDIHNHLIAVVEGTTYYVGQHAIISGQRCRSIEVGVDNNKVESNIVYVNTLAHIAGEACAEAFRAGQDLTQEIQVSVDMATALPVSYYSRALAKQFAEKFTHKPHHVLIYAGPQEISVRITFDYVKVIPEGVTAAHAFLHHPEIFESYNKAHEDKLSTKDMQSARVLHIAIGEGTTEFPITHDGILFDPDFISGTNNGNGHAIDRCIQDFKKIFGLLKFTRQEYSSILRDPFHRYHDTAMDLIEPALDDEAEEILTMAKEVIQKANNEIDLVAVYGGGSILMRQSLENRLQSFCDRAKIRLLYVDEGQAVPIEAIGLNEFVNSAMFQEIKKLSA